MGSSSRRATSRDRPRRPRSAPQSGIGLPAKRRRHAVQPVQTIIGRHDRVRIEPRASTMRNRNCPPIQRAPAPARSGARLPWNAPRGTGRYGTAGRARPAGSRRWRGRAPHRPAAGQRVAEWRRRPRYRGAAPRARSGSEPPAAMHGAERRRRDAPQPKTSAVIVCEPAIGKLCFLGAHGRGGASSGLVPPAPSISASWPFDRAIDAGDRDAVVRRDQAVAGVDQPRLVRLLAREQRADGGGADLRLGIGGEGGFRHGAGDRRVADHVDVRLQRRFERHRIDRAPAGAVGDAGELGDRAGPLRRDDVGDVGLVRCRSRSTTVMVAGIDRGDLAARPTATPIRAGPG